MTMEFRNVRFQQIEKEYFNSYLNSRVTYTLFSVLVDKIS